MQDVRESAHALSDATKFASRIATMLRGGTNGTRVKTATESCLRTALAVDCLPKEIAVKCTWGARDTDRVLTITGLRGGEVKIGTNGLIKKKDL